MPSQRDLLLITGVPGTGKTCYGEKFASEFGFVHYDHHHFTLASAAPAEDASCVSTTFGNSLTVAIFRPQLPKPGNFTILRYFFARSRRF